MRDTISCTIQKQVLRVGQRRAGTIDECTWREMEEGIARSYGTCMTMGTASTMAASPKAPVLAA